MGKIKVMWAAGQVEGYNSDYYTLSIYEKDSVHLDRIIDMLGILWLFQPRWLRVDDFLIAGQAFNISEKNDIDNIVASLNGDNHG
jgi:hypothetical protein